MLKQLLLVVLLACTQYAEAQSFELNSGETVADSSYIHMTSLSGRKSVALSVAFDTAEVTDRIRDASIRELVTDHLLPYALREGVTEAQLQFEIFNAGVGGLKVSLDDDERYFSLRDNWHWEQKGGPTIEWPDFVPKEYVEDHPIGFRFAAVKQIDGEHGRAILIEAISPSDIPLTAFLKIERLYEERSSCGEKDSENWLNSLGANKVRFIVQPEPKTSPMQIVPFIQYTFDKEDGVWPCASRDRFPNPFSIFSTWQSLPKIGH